MPTCLCCFRGSMPSKRLLNVAYPMMVTQLVEQEPEEPRGNEEAHGNDEIRSIETKRITHGAEKFGKAVACRRWGRSTLVRDHDRRDRFCSARLDVGARDALRSCLSCEDRYQRIQICCRHLGTSRIFEQFRADRRFKLARLREGCKRQRASDDNRDDSKHERRGARHA